MALVKRALVAIAVLTLFGLFLSVEAQDPPLDPDAPVAPDAPLAPGFSCGDKSDTSCGECLKNVSCLWCGENKKCIDYPWRLILPSSAICPWDWAQWGVCWVNLKALVIILSLVAGVIIFALLILVCWCCCCRCQKSGGNKKGAARTKQHTRMGNIGAPI